MSNSIIHYTMDSLAVANPDGQKKATVKNCELVDVSPKIFGKFTKALKFKNKASIQVSVPKSAYNSKKFSGRICFKTPSTINSRQNLLEINSLPIAIYLTPGKSATSMNLHVSLHNSRTGWSGGVVRFNRELRASTWYKIEFAYDHDTLAIFINGTLVSTTAFYNGKLKLGAGGKIYIGSWVNGLRFPFKGEMAEVLFQNDIPTALEQKLDSSRSSAAWHISYKYNEIRPNLNFGKRVKRLSNTAEYSLQHYEFGAIMHSTLGTYEIHGSIYSRYKNFSATIQRSLGALQTDEVDGKRRGCKKSLFRTGGIYWSSTTGAVLVKNNIYLHYENLDESGHHIGLPKFTERNAPNGKYQQFQNGRIYYKNGSEAAKEVHGSILKKYMDLGGVAKMGYPVSDEMDVKNGTRVIGKKNDFENCTIYWSPSRGAFEIHGDIRVNYEKIGGPLGQLGFPTSDELDIPGIAKNAKYNTFQNGTIAWFSGEKSYICYPFEIFIDRIKVRDADNDVFWKDDSDIYVRVEVFENNHRVTTKKLPNNGTYSNTTEANLKYTVPKRFIPNNVNDDFKLSLRGWDSDGGRPFGGGDDDLGTYNKVLNIQNAWGLRDNGGIYNRAPGSRSMKLDWSVRPKINQGNMSDRDYYFWGVRNWGNTNSIPWSVYADAFKDVSNDPNFFDHISLRSLYYELFAKDAPKGGNCFGMSLEGVYANKCLSRFGKPLSRFTKNQIKREMNVKHLYQLGAAPIWWFVGQFISGNTHDPKDVFNETLNCSRRGDNPVICISQDYWFTQKPHCIYPHKWKKSGNNWEIICFDPNVTSKETILKVNASSNTYSYKGSSNYSGGQWSGGRLHYMPWRILNSAPRTPNWEMFALLILGSVIVFGDDAETESLVDINGNNLDGTKVKRTDSRADRNKMFIQYPGLDAPQPFNMLLQKGQALNNNFKHKIKGKKNTDFKYAISNLNQEVMINSALSRNELETYDFEKLGRIDNEVSVLNTKNKLYDIAYSHKISGTNDIFRLKVDKIPTAKNSDLKFNVKPNFEGVDIISSGGSSTGRITAEILNNKNKVINRKQFSVPLEAGLRIRATSILNNNELIVGKINNLKGVLRNPIRIKTN
ncbi:hypothetical protein ULMS_19450 [Patiriisocius marinistellae]|uniref:Uncharacterized protein n=1 Tax=Patiriisocius marinistellae TaxID=2494560 RepID=A0A5J4FUU6_9FLAO|nr:LamG-like jellyroll fold domain-containing protein [Patiriisocius marinistellae]GEQ86437.1 hypothetical protein ULMS_19450 [Patiriisocius marinistellae]